MKKKGKTMENKADFTHKELCLLLETICKNELGVHLAKNIKDLRSKVNVFKNDDTISIKKNTNKQGKTRVSVFTTYYCDDNNHVATAYTPTL